MHHNPQHLVGILTLPTLLRLMAAVGAGMGLINAGLWAAVYWRQLSAGQVVGVLIAGVLFNTLALSFATLVGYWPYRALADRRRWGLHRLSIYLLQPEPAPRQDA